MTVTRHPLRPATGAPAGLPIDVDLVRRLERSFFAFVARGNDARSVLAREVGRRAPALAARCDELCASALLPAMGLFLRALRDAGAAETAAERLTSRLERSGFDRDARDTLSTAFVAALESVLGPQFDARLRGEWLETLALARQGRPDAAESPRAATTGRGGIPKPPTSGR